MRILLFKRFESSVYAFRMTIGRLIKIHEAFGLSIENGIIPAGEEAQKILYGSDQYSEEELIRALREVSTQYSVGDFDIERLKIHINHDLQVLKSIMEMVNEQEIPPERDMKLQTLKKILNEQPLNRGKVLIFSESAETVDYIFENINPDNQPEIKKASTQTENKQVLVNRFAPIANKHVFRRGEVEIQTLVATDVLSEGLNLQDCDKIINYDLHWNPVKLIQRFGRIDRIGSEYDQIFGFNFLPETDLDKNLNLHQVVHQRIQEIHDTIGEDSAILDNTEQINHEAMYAIYEREMKQLSLFEEALEKENISFNEAEEELRQLQQENPDEYNRIANLRDGLRCVVSAVGDEHYIFCQADRYNQLYLVNNNGEILTREITEILAKLKNQIGKTPVSIPADYPKIVHKVKGQFIKEVVERYLEQKHTISLTESQRYLIKELRQIFAETDNEDLKTQVELFENVYKKVNRIAVLEELNRIRRNKMSGMALIKKLSEIFTRHSLYEVLHLQNRIVEKPPIPKVICSEQL
jgi:hypothetical protein